MIRSTSSCPAWALAGLAAALILLAACTAAPVASSQASNTPPSPSPSPSSTIPDATALPTSSPSAQMLASTTESASEGPAGSVEIDMFGPPPAFREESYGVAAGDAVFFLRNTSPDLLHATHALAIGPELGNAVAVSDDVRAGRSAIFTVEGLDAGTYVIWCPHRDHAELGQVGTLTVE